MHVLQALLGPVPVREFFHHHFTRVPFAMPDHATLYTQDFSDADFAAMVEDSHSILRIVRDGRLVHDRARLSWAEAQVYYQSGHTLLVRHAARASAKLQALAEAFAHVFHAPVNIQVYLTPDQSQAFGWHYPSGWWHIAQTQTASIHLSVGVMPVVGLHLFAFLQHRLAQDPFWCQRLTWVAQEEAGRPAPSEPAHQRWEDMCAQLQQVLAQEQTCQEFLAYLVDPTRGRSSDRPAHHP